MLSKLIINNEIVDNICLNSLNHTIEENLQDKNDIWLIKGNKENFIKAYGNSQDGFYVEMGVSRRTVNATLGEIISYDALIKLLSDFLEDEKCIKKNYRWYLVNENKALSWYDRFSIFPTLDFSIIIIVCILRIKEIAYLYVLVKYLIITIIGYTINTKERRSQDIYITYGMKSVFYKQVFNIIVSILFILILISNFHLKAFWYVVIASLAIILIILILSSLFRFIDRSYDKIYAFIEEKNKKKTAIMKIMGRMIVLFLIIYSGKEYLREVYRIFLTR